jgi:hypothetical protein
MKKMVVHCKREPFDVYIGRPSKWGNPFTLRSEKDRARAIEQYRAYLLNQPELMAALPALRGKVLGCWCAPKSCHGDVLAELAALSKAPDVTRAADQPKREP